MRPQGGKSAAMFLLRVSSAIVRCMPLLQRCVGGSGYSIVNNKSPVSSSMSSLLTTTVTLTVGVKTIVTALNDSYFGGDSFLSSILRNLTVLPGSWACSAR